MVGVLVKGRKHFSLYLSWPQATCDVMFDVL